MAIEAMTSGAHDRLPADRTGPQALRDAGWRARRARFGIGAGMAAVGVATFAFRWLSLEKLSNDHFDHVARAYQVLLGDWPVRDFVDPGLPLAYLLSAAAASAAAPIMAETALFAAAFALAAAISFRAAAVVSGSIVSALFAVALQVAAYPRSYSYPKLLVYALAVIAAWWVVDRSPRQNDDPADARAQDPGLVALTPLAAATAIAYYFRHDHGVYVAIGSLVLLVMHLRPRGLTAVVRATRTYLLATFALVLPHLMYVQWYVGLRSYLAVARSYSRMEVQINPYEVPGLALDLSSQNSAAILFWMCWLVPVLALIVLLRARSEPAVRNHTAKVAMLIALAICLNVGLLRNPLVVRLPDVATPQTILGAWLLATLWRWPLRGVARVAGRSTLAAVMLMLGIAVFSAFGTTRYLERARVWQGPGAMLQRWNEVFDELGEDRPDVMPGLSKPVLDFLDYVSQCTFEADRLVYVGYEPSLFVAAHRGFGGGHMMFLGRFHSAPEEQALTVQRLAKAQVPFVLLPAASGESFREVFPQVWSYVHARYVKLTSLDADPGQLDVLIDAGRKANSSTTYQATGWPCLI